MAQEIYHRSEWGNPNEQWGNVYLNADLTNELYKRASEYENSWVTDQLLNGVGTKPSIILTPTAYGDGVLNSVKPKRTFGSELVTNGTFDTDSNWSFDNVGGTKGWRIADNRAICDVSGVSNGRNLQQYLDISITSGKKYKISLDILQSDDNISLFIGGQTVTLPTGTNLGYETTFVASSTSTLIVFFAGTSDTQEIDNVSIKEQTEADFDFTRGSSATRVNAQGLVEDVQILSSNLVQNGDFSQEGAELVTNGDFATDSDWVKTSQVTIENGIANIVSNDGSFQLLGQNNVVTTGKYYVLTYTIVSSNSGSLKFSSLGQINSTIGTHKLYFVATETAINIARNSGITDISIDNVSVKEVGQDWTFTSGATLTALGAKITHTPTAGSIAQLSVLTLGKQYKLTYEITESISGGLKFNSAVNPSMVTTVGVHTKYFEADGTTAVIGRTSATDNDVTITNISVIEITDDTNLPRINYTNFDYEDVLGDELVTNGNFDTDSDWIKQSSWSIANGSANCDGSGGFRSISQSALTNQVGKTYKISYEVSNYVSGEVRFILGGLNLGQIISANGVHTETIQAVNPSTNSFIYIETRGSGFIGSIDNVSVKELTEDVVVPYSGEGSLLLEPQSTNLITYSEDFSDVSWLKEGGATIELDADISPSGSINASYLKAPSTTNATLRITYSFTSTASQTYVGSVFVKKQNIDFIRILSTGATSSTLQAFYNVSNGTLGTSGTPSKATIEDYGNGWYRLNLIIDAVNTTSDATFRVQLAKTDGAVINDFDGTEKNLIWGAQLEQSLSATSYIPTEGSIKTRLQDAAFGAGSSDLINSTEGVLYAEIMPSPLQCSFALSDGSIDNRVSFNYQYGIDIRTNIRIGGTQKKIIGGGNISDSFHKIAVRWDDSTNILSFYKDGGLVNTVSYSGSLGVNTLNNVSFTQGDGTSSNFFGKTKCVAVFKEALSDTELQKLTQV